jgi:HSP20 family protein
MMAVFSDPFNALSNFQQALDSFRASSWLDAGPSGGGAYPPMNVFRKGDDFIIITELPGVKKSDIEVQVKGRTLRLSGTKTVAFPEEDLDVALENDVLRVDGPHRLCEI